MNDAAELRAADIRLDCLSETSESKLAELSTGMRRRIGRRCVASWTAAVSTGTRLPFDGELASRGWYGCFTFSKHIGRR